MIRLLVVALILAGVLSAVFHDRSAPASPAAQATADATAGPTIVHAQDDKLLREYNERKAKELQERQAKFNAGKPKILTSIRSALNRGDIDGAWNLAIVEYADVSDPDLDKLSATIRDRASAEQTKRKKALAKKEGVNIGMTKEQVLESSWGRPQSVNRTVTATGTSEQWVYRGYQYLYFDNEKLTSIQTH